MCVLGSQKVWLQLEEKQIPYTIEKINMRCYGDKPREYTAKVVMTFGPFCECALYIVVCTVFVSGTIFWIWMHTVKRLG